MDPVGMTNACTSVVVPNSSNRMVMAHSAIAPRGGSALAAGCGATGSVTVVFWSVGGFIAPALSVYQGVGAGTERSPRARYRYSPAPTRSPRLENRCYPRHRASREQKKAYFEADQHEEQSSELLNPRPFRLRRFVNRRWRDHGLHAATFWSAGSASATSASVHPAGISSAPNNSPWRG